MVRRRLDDEPRIDFRYESEVADLAFDRANNAIVGVAVDNGDADGGDGLQVVPAEFVVDASGKNTRVPEFLSVSVLALPRPSRTSSTASTPRCSTGFRRSGGGRTR